MLIVGLMLYLAPNMRLKIYVTTNAESPVI